VSFYFGVCVRVCFIIIIIYFYFFYYFEVVFDCGSCRGRKNENVVLCQKCV